MYHSVQAQIFKQGATKSERVTVPATRAGVRMASRIARRALRLGVAQYANVLVFRKVGSGAKSYPQH